MSYRSLLLFLLVSFSSAHAYDGKVEIVEQFDSVRMIAFIDKNELKKNPEWNANTSAIPLSVDDAIKAVKQFNASQRDEKSIEEIEIRPVPKHQNHWHYLIKVANPQKSTRHDIYVVLMNGKVIPGMIEPEAYK